MKLIIDGDTYEAPERQTYRERRLIKQVTGLAGLEWVQAVERMDDDVALGLAAVALQRAGRFPGVEAMLDREIDTITLDFSDELRIADDEAEEAGDGRPPAGAEDDAGQEAEGSSRRSSSASASSKTRPRSGTRS